MVGASVCAPACGVTCCANVCHAVRVPVHVPPQDVHGRGDQGTGERGHDKAQARRRGRLGQGWYDVAAGDGRSPGARRRGPWCRGHQVRPLSVSPAAPRLARRASWYGAWGRSCQRQRVHRGAYLLQHLPRPSETSLAGARHADHNGVPVSPPGAGPAGVCLLFIYCVLRRMCDKTCVQTRGIKELGNTERCESRPGPACPCVPSAY